MNPRGLALQKLVDGVCSAPGPFDLSGDEDAGAGPVCSDLVTECFVGVRCIVHVGCKIYSDQAIGLSDH